MAVRRAVSWQKYCWDRKPWTMPSCQPFYLRAQPLGRGLAGLCIMADFAASRLADAHGAMAEWLCSGLQIRVPRFDSELRLQIHTGFQPFRADAALCNSGIASRNVGQAGHRAGFFALARRLPITQNFELDKGIAPSPSG